MRRPWPKTQTSFVEPYVVSNGKRFKLKDHDPDDKRWVKSKDHGKELLQTGVAELCELQEKLYAQDQWGLLLVFQAMDAAGKDGAIKHVMSGVNPQGCQVSRFKAPSAEELDHDFLWRTSKALPGARPHRHLQPLVLRGSARRARASGVPRRGQKLPRKLVTKHIWKERFEDINAFERYLSRNGYVILKFFLNVSKKEQKKRFLERLTMPEKNWKFSTADVKERGHWDDYMKAYEDTIRRTATPARALGRRACRQQVVRAHRRRRRRDLGPRGLDLKFPVVDKAKMKDLDAARIALEGKNGSRPKAAQETDEP